MNEVKMFSLILNIIWILGMVASMPNTRGFAEDEDTDGTVPVNPPAPSAEDATADGIEPVNTLSVEDHNVAEPTEPPYDCEAELYENTDDARTAKFFGSYFRSKRYIRQDAHNRQIYKFGVRNTYNVLVYPEDADPAAVDRVVDEAFTMWADHTFKRFTRVRSEGADLSISFVYGRHSRVVFEDGRISKSDTPRTESQGIYFNGTVNWSFEPTTDPQKVEFLQKLLHEIGFALGLADSDQTESIMYPKYRHNFPAKLYPDDIMAIQSIFGTRNCKKNLPEPGFDNMCSFSQMNSIIVSVDEEYFFILAGRIFRIEEREKPKHFSQGRLWLQIGEEVTDGFLKTNFTDAGVRIVGSVNFENRTTYFFTLNLFYVYHWDSGTIEGPKNTSAVYGIDVDVIGVFMFPNDPEIYFATRVFSHIPGTTYVQNVYYHIRKRGGEILKNYNGKFIFTYKNRVIAHQMYDYHEIKREQIIANGMDFKPTHLWSLQADIMGCNSAPLPGELQYSVIPPYEPSGKDDVCKSSEFDALVTISGSAHVFRYDRVYKLVELPVLEIHNKSIRFKIAQGYPKYIRDEFPPLPDNIESAVAIKDTVYFFQGRRVWLMKDGKISPPELTSKYFRPIPHPISAIFFEKNNTLLFQKKLGFNHYLFVDHLVKHLNPYEHFGKVHFRIQNFGEHRGIVYAFSYDSFIPINGTTQKFEVEVRTVSFEAFGEISTRNRTLSKFEMDIKKDLFGC